MKLNVQNCFTNNRSRGMSRGFVVGLMLVLWLGTAALAASPDLHQWFHKDSQNITHECVVTLLSKSHLVAGATGCFVLALIRVFFGGLLIEESSPLCRIDFRLSPSRAPPAFVFSSTVVG
jgi:hypothetical protein